MFQLPLLCSQIRVIAVSIGVDVILTTGLEVDESGFSVEKTDILYYCPESSSRKSFRLSRPNRDKSGTQLGKETYSIVDNSDFIGKEGKAGDSKEVD